MLSGNFLSPDNVAGKTADGILPRHRSEARGEQPREDAGHAGGNKIPVISYHFAWPGYGHVAKAGHGFHYDPEPMVMTL
jgi:hypothetical protein